MNKIKAHARAAPENNICYDRKMARAIRKYRMPTNVTLFSDKAMDLL